MKAREFVFGAITLVFLAGCSDDDGIVKGIDVPSTYEFTRDGQSTVSFTGQTQRLDMLSEIKAVLVKGDNGELVTEELLLDMFANENSPFADTDLNASTKQLEDKTFPADITYYKDLFAEAAAASADAVANGSMADAGVAGRIERGNSGKFILVNEKGHEFTQFIEKGLIGSVFFHQIFNVYLTDDRVGDDVDNTTIEEGTNYTAMEHHWDEAFGYWGVPVDFPEELAPEDKRFWATYTYARDPFTGSKGALKDAYLIGRTAIFNKDYPTKNEQREILYREHELVSAATAVSYINSAISDLNNGDQGNALHHISEAYMFVRAIQFNPTKELSNAQIDEILTQHLGEDSDFWKVTIDGLNTAKGILTTTYPSLADVADQL